MTAPFSPATLCNGSRRAMVRTFAFRPANANLRRRRTQCSGYRILGNLSKILECIRESRFDGARPEASGGSTAAGGAALLQLPLPSRIMEEARRVVAKVEWHPSELYPRGGFIVTNLARPAERVVAFYNHRGTCEQYIKEGKGAIKWTRL
jgi:hypothetical protein